MKQNIDWVTVFGEFGGMFDGMIRPALDEAKNTFRQTSSKTPTRQVKRPRSTLSTKWKNHLAVRED